LIQKEAIGSLGIFNRKRNFLCQTSHSADSFGYWPCFIFGPCKINFELYTLTFNKNVIILTIWCCLIRIIITECDFWLWADWVSDLINVSKLSAVKIQNFVESKVHIRIVRDFVEALVLEICCVALCIMLKLMGWGFIFLNLDLEGTADGKYAGY
jgi:hypothetical protein